MAADKNPLERLGDELAPLLDRYGREIAATDRDPLPLLAGGVLITLAEWFASFDPEQEANAARLRLRLAVVEALVAAEDAIEEAPDAR